MARVIKKNNSLRKKIVEIETQIIQKETEYKNFNQGFARETRYVKIIVLLIRLLVLGLGALVWIVAREHDIPAYFYVLLLTVIVVAIAGWGLAPSSQKIMQQNQIRKKTMLLYNELSRWRKGYESEQKVYEALLSLPDNYFILNDVKIFNSKQKTIKKFRSIMWS